MHPRRRFGRRQLGRDDDPLECVGKEYPPWPCPCRLLSRARRASRTAGICEGLRRPTDFGSSSRHTWTGWLIQGGKETAEESGGHAGPRLMLAQDLFCPVFGCRADEIADREVDKVSGEGKLGSACRVGIELTTNLFGPTLRVAACCSARGRGCPRPADCCAASRQSGLLGLLLSDTREALFTAPLIFSCSARYRSEQPDRGVAGMCLVERGTCACQATR